MSKCALLTLFAATSMRAQNPNFKHIVVIVQENRTPDNLFQGLCSPPFGSSASCGINPTAAQYNIQVSGWLDKTSPTGVTKPKAVALAGPYDLDHSHDSFLTMCNMTGGACKMDGAAGIPCLPNTP
ncbi:MAG TPA: hypothetical protein VI756_03960, partial [Blastocatellia bacterium]